MSQKDSIIILASNLAKQIPDDAQTDPRDAASHPIANRVVLKAGR